MVILNGGDLSMGGTTTYYGVLYYTSLTGTNLIPSSQVIDLEGTTEVYGGVVVEGAGMVTAGSSGVNVKFDANAFGNIKSIGSAGIVQNTWRELTPR
jgi:hypothetical protein